MTPVEGVDPVGNTLVDVHQVASESGSDENENRLYKIAVLDILDT